VISFLAGAAGFLVFALITPFLIRSRVGGPPPVVHAAVFVILLILTMLAGSTAIASFVLSHAFALYCFLVVVYVFVFGTVYKSVSLNLLIELAARGGTMPMSAVSNRILQVFSARAAILVGTGHARQHGELRVFRPEVDETRGMELGGRLPRHIDWQLTSHRLGKKTTVGDLQRKQQLHTLKKKIWGHAPLIGGTLHALQRWR
jgi:hypothetical protein